MKKSKKFLLWAIIPILGISSGVAGAITSVTSQSSLVNQSSIATLNSTTSLAKSKTVGEVESKLKIVDQTYDLLLNSEDIGDELFVKVENKIDNAILSYTWKVNKGNGWEIHTLHGSNTLFINTPDDVESMITWTFKCVITDINSGESITSEDIKFTVTPWEGDDIEVTTQPMSHQNVSGGQKVTLTTEAEFNEDSIYEGKEIGYRWFEYDSKNNKFIFIADANSNTYEFIAPYSSKTLTKKYVCKFYLKSKVGVYISESDQAIVTINKSESTGTPTKTLKVKSSVITNQASVRANFNPNTRVDSSWYKVEIENDTKTSSEVTYQWYYVGRDGKEHLIENASSNELKPNKNLFEAIYKDNYSHKATIMCKIYKDGKLDTIVDQKTNSRFYLSVVVNNRMVRVSNNLNH